MWKRTIERGAIKSSGRESGFTLVELMVVIILIGLFAGVVGMSVIQLVGRGRKTVALDQMKVLKEALEFYKLDTGSYPETLEELTTPTSESEKGYMPEIPLDPWGESYEYDPSGGTVYDFDLFSKGEDKVAGTDDDVSLTTAREQGSQ
jgi:general secretion pathway protein G